MFRIPLPLEDSALLVVPRWAELGPILQITLLVSTAVLPLLLVLWLYRYELRLVRRAAARGLLAVRLLMLLMLWCVVALQPIVARYSTEELPGRVLVAVDRSGSMAVTDPQRTAAEKLNLAHALKLPEEADKSKDHLDRLTRGEIARRLLAADGAGFLSTLSARHKVELIGFHKDAWDVPPASMADLFLKDSSSGTSYTDLRLPLQRALGNSGQEGRRILGIVLFTDGQHNLGPSPVAKALEMAERRIPIYPVALGGRSSPPDVAILEMKAPANVFKGVDANVEVRVRVAGLPAQDVVVELLENGQAAPEHHRVLAHDGTDRVYHVRFQARLDKVGTHTLTVNARPASKDVREISEANNQATAVVRVASDKARVLLADCEARWEYQYLANVLRRDRSMELDSVLFQQPRIGKIAEPNLEKIGNPRLTLPVVPAPAEDQKGEQPDPLLLYDCIILGDVSPEQLSPADRRRLERYVAQHGGTLVLLAGKRSLPLAYQDAAGEDDPLLKMLPVEKPHAISPADGFPVTLTQEGSSTPFLQLETEPDMSATRWAALPRHFWGVIGQTKPGAVSLAFQADPAADPKAQASKDSVETTQALIARQNYGFGRVLFVGLDSTWRWRFKVGDTYHHRFWGQVARWAAADKLLPAGNRYVRFGTRAALAHQGKEIEILARLAEDVPPLPPGALAGARIYRRSPDGKEQAVALVPLAPGLAQPRTLAGQVRDLPPGQYRLELEIPSLSDKLKAPPDPEDESEDRQRRDTFTVLPPESSEMTDLATNWPLLEDLAARTGGEVIAPENLHRLVERLASQVVRREHREDEKLWQDAPAVWGTLGLLVLLLTVEWVGRKMAGLP
jgi:hypothetical protein